jgi:hypothetical protein
MSGSTTTGGSSSISSTGANATSSGSGGTALSSGSSGGDSTGGGSVGTSTSGGVATTGSSAGSTGGSTGTVTTGSSLGLSTAGGFIANTELAGYAGPLSDGGTDPSVVVIDIARIDQGSQTCAGILPGGGGPFTGPAILIILTTGDGTPIRKGRYPIAFPPRAADGGLGAVCLLGELDAGNTAVGVDGSVIVTRVGDDFAGSFGSMLELLDGGSFGELSGGFNAPNCGPLYTF